MDYDKDILNRLLGKYESRGAFDKEASSFRAIQIDVKKSYPAYEDRYNHEAYKDINAAIERLIAEGLIAAAKNSTGQYTRVKLKAELISECYKRLKRISIPEQCEAVKQVLNLYANSNQKLMRAIISDWTELLIEYKKLPYDFKYDSRRVKEVLQVIEAILRLNKETYIRNFSTALFKDSKRFQKKFKACVEGVLFDYTEEAVEKDKILEFYNLYENPTYVLAKGNMKILFENSVIDLAEMPDGIAFSNASLDKIRSIAVYANKIITVENLTTYHDADEEKAVYIYLGGYLNHSKQTLLEKIYADNKACKYLHQGDLDVYGFLILENLKERTGIPFMPFMMDIETLERFLAAGIYKKLTLTDVKKIEEKKYTKLSVYADVLQFMLDNNCKVEQESIKALELMEENLKKVLTIT
jgi:putative uncharacterized protein (fragment)